MCLLLLAPSSNLKRVFLNTPGVIEDVYRSNPDGLGIVYNTSKGVKVIKALPKNAADARALLSKMPDDDRQVTVHWRMRTHGDINTEGVHPVKVDGGYLLHNGVLACGNAKDKTKSDTFHFGTDYLSNGVLTAVAHNPKFTALLGDHIGNNRFVLVTDDGRMSLVNEQQGWWFDGIWFSNEYACDRQMIDPSHTPKYQKFTYTGYTGKWAGAKHSAYSADEDEYDFQSEVPMLGFAGGFDKHAESFASYGSRGALATADSLNYLLESGDIDSMSEYLGPAHIRANLNTLFDAFGSPDIEVDAISDLEPPYMEACKALFEEDIKALMDLCQKGYTAEVAEAIIYFSVWPALGYGYGTEEADNALYAS